MNGDRLNRKSLNVTSPRLQRLVDRSIDVLESLLQDREVSPLDRAAIALKILEATGVNVRQTLPSVNVNLPNSPLVLGGYVQMENFLSPSENKQALEIAIASADQFVASTTTTGAVNYRESSIVYATKFPEYYQFMKHRILETLPQVLSQLKHPPFTVTEVEMQLTAHHNGGYYKIHNDSSSAKTKTRTITYVYYFYDEPKAFTGGQLRLYETELRNGVAYNKETFKTIEPINNSIVFFDSRCKHEVIPVSCNSPNFKDGRFTLNGWLRRGED